MSKTGLVLSVGRKGGVGKAQDAVIRPIFHGLTGQIRAQAKCLPHGNKVPDLWEERVPT